MTVTKLQQHSSEQLELLEPLLAPAEADQCEAIGQEFIESRIHLVGTPDYSGDSTSSTALDLLRSLKLSLIERGGILATLPRDRFASQQLGLDLLTYQALRDRPSINAELLQHVLHRFQHRARYWSEVEQLLLQSAGRKPIAG
ncbi:hypothetical protein AXX02_03695 [Pseudomonas aeruginosa]|nr:hypothetical protein D0Y56_21780 [Pseudomonas aeruginosa]RIZ45415.1 hypothetical protein AXX02_03695 [Pseudomonas aeruginosa]